MCTTGHKLNRSCSESDLHNENFGNKAVKNYCDGFENRRGVIVKGIVFTEEVVYSNSCDYFRRGTTYQVLGRSTPDHLHNIENLFITDMLNKPFSNSSLPTSTVYDKFGTTTGTNYSSYINRDDMEPMEIDTLHDNSKSEDCVDFIEAMDTDINYDLNSRYSNLDNVLKKRYLQNTVKSTDVPNLYSTEGKSIDNKTMITSITQIKKKDSQHSTCILILVLAFMLTLVYLIFLHDILYVNSDVQYQNIQDDLFEKVYGQNASLNAVVRSLQQRERWDNKVKVLSFVGSTGVGKTFVANIIKKHFPRELVHELFGVQLNYESQRSKILSELKPCCLNLIIIDDLKRKDTLELFAFAHSLPQEQFALIISIFNIQYTNDKINYKVKYTDITEIRKELDNSGLYHEVIIFNEFHEDQVKVWIEKQLGSQNIDLTLQEKILNDTLKGHEVKHSGLKGLYNKLLLELEKYTH